MAKVINYRLIEEISQVFDKELFLPYCKLYNNAFEKSVNFHFKIKSISLDSQSI